MSLSSLNISSLKYTSSHFQIALLFSFYLRVIFFFLLPILLAVLALIFLRCFRILTCRIILRGSFLFCHSSFYGCLYLIPHNSLLRTRLYWLCSLLPCCGFLNPVSKSVGSLAEVLPIRLYLLPRIYLLSFHLVTCSKPVSNLLPWKGHLDPIIPQK